MVCIKILLSRWMQSWPPRRSVLSSLQEWYKTYTFIRKIHFLFFLHTFRWTRRMQWSQLRRRVFGERPKIFAQCAETLKKHIIQKNDLHKGPIVSWMQCWPPRWNFPRSLRGRFINYNFFEKSIFSFSLICSSGHEVFSDYNIAGEFSTKCRKCFVQCKKKRKKRKTQKTDLHEVPVVSVNAVLTTPPNFFSQSPRMV